MKESTSDFFAAIPADADEARERMERIGGHPDGYCELYKYDKGGRFRTLKCLQPSFRGKPLYENLLRKEFEIGYSLSHPHICEYYEWQNHPLLGSCIEMEWIDGRTLEQMIAEGRYPREIYDKIVTEICDALGYMHSKQVLHKDLKPSNILITYNGNNVKIIDFGLSDSDSSSVLKISAGTAAYAAPEVLQGGKSSVSSDLYSLGRVLSIFPVRKYASVIRRLCATDPARRPGSVHETMRLMKRSASALPGILFILLVTVFTVWVLVNPTRTPQDKPVTDADMPVVDTTVATGTDELFPESPDSSNTVPQAAPVPRSSPRQQPRPTADESAPAPAPAENEEIDPSLIDEVFHQATGLFEE